MATKVWTLRFMWVYFANLLLYVSLYMFFPILPVEMAKVAHISYVQSGFVMVFATLGMLVAGPFYAYVLDAYKRKLVCLFSLLLTIAGIYCYLFVSTAVQLWLLSGVQGIVFGFASTACVTLGIDVTSSKLRSMGNTAFTWGSRLGLMIGMVSGVFIWLYYGFHVMQIAAMLTCALAFLCALCVKVPFHAPILTCVCSLDRFFLPRAWLPALNILLIGCLPGLLLPLLSAYYFIWIGAGFLFISLLKKFFKTGLHWCISAGLVLICLALFGSMFLPDEFCAFLLGMGLGLVVTEFLILFINLSEHCERGTANTTHLLSWEIGLALGYACSWLLLGNGEFDVVPHVLQAVSALALLLFAFATYPYYLKKKVR